MKRLLNKALRVAGMLMMAAAPACPSTFLSFNIGTGSGTWTDNASVWSGTMTLSQLIETDPSTGYNATFTLPAGDFFSLAFNSGTPSLTISTTGTSGSPFANVGASTALYGGTTSLSFNSTNSTATTLSETVNSTTVTGVNANFLADLHLAGATTFTISGGITGSNGTISSDSITIVTPTDVSTPEPSSAILFGAGFLAIATVFRKRRFRLSDAARA